MERRDNHVELDEIEASSGSKEGVVRWMLLGGLVLAIILLSITWIVPAMMHEDYAPGETEASTAMPGDNPNSNDDFPTDMGNDQHATGGKKPVEEDGLEVIEN